MRKDGRDVKALGKMKEKGLEWRYAKFQRALFTTEPQKKTRRRYSVEKTLKNGNAYRR